MPPRPSTLIAELSYQCPLHCPYCSNPLDIGGEHYRAELETEHWLRAFAEARRLGVLQLALTGGEPMLRPHPPRPGAGAPEAGPEGGRADAAPRPRRAVRGRARGGPVLVVDHRRHAVHARGRRDAEGGG